MCVLLFAALLAYKPPSEATRRQVLPAALVVAAGLSALSVGILPWMALLAACLLVSDFLRRKSLRAILLGWGALVILALAFSIPSLIAASKLVPTASSGGPEDLGNLAEPVPAWAASGIWITPDYRYGLDAAGTVTVNSVGIAVVIALILAGLIAALLRKEWLPLGLGAAAVGTLGYYILRTGVWAELKAFAVTSPIALTLAAFGLAAIWPIRRLRWLAGVAGLVVICGVAAGNALVYRNTTLAPYDRLEELRQIGEVLDGQGPTFHPEFEEYAEYLLRKSRATTLVNSPTGVSGLLPSSNQGLLFSRDLDEYDIDFLRQFRYLVLRHEPVASRPSSAFRLVTRRRFYEVWERAADASRIRLHIPDDGHPEKRTPRFCGRAEAKVAAVGKGAQLAYALTPLAGSAVGQPTKPLPSWRTAPPFYMAKGPGHLVYPISVPKSGRYDLWILGSFGRQVTLELDGRQLARVRWRVSYPDQYVWLGAERLSAGKHRIDMRRGGGSLLPGTGNDDPLDGLTTTIGPVIVSPSAGRGEVRYMPAAEFPRLCRSGRSLDWIEILR